MHNLDWRCPSCGYLNQAIDYLCESCGHDINLPAEAQHQSSPQTKQPRKKRGFWVAISLFVLLGASGWFLSRSGITANFTLPLRNSGINRKIQPHEEEIRRLTSLIKTTKDGEVGEAAFMKLRKELRALIEITEPDYKNKSQSYIQRTRRMSPIAKETMSWSFDFLMNPKENYKIREAASLFIHAHLPEYNPKDQQLFEPQLLMMIRMPYEESGLLVSRSRTRAVFIFDNLCFLSYEIHDKGFGRELSVKDEFQADYAKSLLPKLKSLPSSPGDGVWPLISKIETAFRLQDIQRQVQGER